MRRLNVLSVLCRGVPLVIKNAYDDRLRIRREFDRATAEVRGFVHVNYSPSENLLETDARLLVRPAILGTLDTPGDWVFPDMRDFRYPDDIEIDLSSMSPDDVVFDYGAPIPLLDCRNSDDAAFIVEHVNNLNRGGPSIWDLVITRCNDGWYSVCLRYRPRKRPPMVRVSALTQDGREVNPILQDVPIPPIRNRTIEPTPRRAVRQRIRDEVNDG